MHGHTHPRVLPSSRAPCSALELSSVGVTLTGGAAALPPLALLYAAMPCVRKRVGWVTFGLRQGSIRSPYGECLLIEPVDAEATQAVRKFKISY